MFPIIKKQPKQVTPEQKNFDELNRKIVELESQIKMKDKKIKSLESQLEQEKERSSAFEKQLIEKKETPVKIEERKPIIIEDEPEEKPKENSRYNHRKNRFNFEE